MKEIRVVLERFKLLESVHFNLNIDPEDILEIRDRFPHEMLKQLAITCYGQFQITNTKSLLRLVHGACPNLERIMLSKLQKVTLEDFKQILDHNKRLSHLNLTFDKFELCLEAMDTIKTSETKLACLCLKGLYGYPTDAIIKTFFEHDFPNIKFREYVPGCYWVDKFGRIIEKELLVGTLVMKKVNVLDWNPDKLNYLDLASEGNFSRSRL